LGALGITNIAPPLAFGCSASLGKGKYSISSISFYFYADLPKLNKPDFKSILESYG